MAILPPDFKEFLKLLNANGVKYLLIGGYAVGYYGYPRATADIDIWIAIAPDNAQNVVNVLQKFGYTLPSLTPHLFLKEDQIVRMGVPPLRIEILTGIDGVSFDECYSSAVIDQIDDTPVYLISRDDLKKNKLASGRHKDLDDLEHLG